MKRDLRLAGLLIAVSALFMFLAEKMATLKRLDRRARKRTPAPEGR